MTISARGAANGKVINSQAVYVSGSIDADTVSQNEITETEQDIITPPEITPSPDEDNVVEETPAVPETEESITLGDTPKEEEVIAEELKPEPEQAADEKTLEDDAETVRSSEVGQGTPQPKLVDFTADIMRPIKKGSDTTTLIGNVILYHNGAVITSDSAVRYNENYMEFFKRVVINQESTYVYGDRVDYNGELNRANVYAPIIKVVSDTSVLYTYNLTFNTLDKVGEFYGTGTLVQGDNMMESERGYYYTDTRDVVGVKNVQLSNPEYKMKSDSVVYNLDRESAEFFTTTHVWNEKGEILIADRGKYFNATGEYKFTSNSYILTKDQEVWADSLDYDSRLDNVVLRRDIQIRDEENNVMAFGDYGEYWGETEYAMLTADPSLVSFEQDQPDTVYMRSDSMFFYTYDIDYVFESSLLPKHDQGNKPIVGEELIMPLETHSEGDEIEDGKRTVADGEEGMRIDGQETVLEDDALRDYGTDEPVLDDYKDSSEPEFKDVADSVGSDQDTGSLMDSLTVRDVTAVPEGKVNEDTVQRVMFAYYDVRIFRNDFQAVCDSLVAFSKDSTAHLYIDPVLWNENNQVTSDIMDIYTRDEKLYKAEFVGNPFMSSEVDTVRYNQIKGRFMTAWFRDNEIYRHDVKGNGQVHYYDQDEDTGELMGFLVVESSDLYFLIEEKKIDQITFLTEPVYTGYPMDKIPVDLEQQLPGFKWEAARRPLTKEDVFKRIIRPSVREEVTGLPQPEFPITEAIMENKEKMIENGIWRERNDVLSQSTLDFIRSRQIDREQ